MVGIAILVGACGVPGTASRRLATAPSHTPSSSIAEPVGGTVRLLFAGDVMLGRQVTAVAEREGPILFEQIRHVVSSAELVSASVSRRTAL